MFVRQVRTRPGGFVAGLTHSSCDYADPTASLLANLRVYTRVRAGKALLRLPGCGRSRGEQSALLVELRQLLPCLSRQTVA